MLFINSNEFNQLEYDLAKVVFMENYSDEFTIDSQNLNSQKNYFYAEEILSKRKTIIFMFDKPSSAWLINNKQYQIIVYQIQKRRASNDIYQTKKLSSKYIKDYYYVLNSIIDNYNVIEKYRYYKFFINKYQFDIISDKGRAKTLLKCKYCYKYYKNDPNGGQLLTKESKEVTFVDPNTFNDPFDCDCKIGGQDKKDQFRVLCVTEKYDNILMWSYYGNYHQGYCKRYSVETILNNISTMLHTTGICFYGNISYRKKRPAYDLKKVTSTYDERKHYIRCLFTKYKEWNHESEIRFVVISDGYMPDKVKISGGADFVYQGCCNDYGKAVQLHKNNKTYGLK